MNQKVSEINQLLVEVYSNITKIEEVSLKNGTFHDLSITEIHTLEAVGLYGSKTMSEAAASLAITTGTLTIAINRLIKKGYVQRSRDETDRRVVNISLTKKGKLAYRIHEKFHQDMVEQVVTNLTQEEEQALVSGLKKLNFFLKEVCINSAKQLDRKRENHTKPDEKERKA